MMAARRVKVFYLIPSLVQGGAERQILELITRLPERFEPVLALWTDQVHYRETLPAGQPRYVLGTDRMTRGAFRRLVEILRAERPDIVHCYLNRANFWGRLAARKARVPIVVASCRARMIELRYLPFERWLSERSQLVLVNSLGIRDELVTLARVRPERIRVIHNFLDLGHFRPPSEEERRAARARYGLSAETRVLTMPGRISVQKHQLSFLWALERLARDGRLPSDVIVLLPGRGGAKWIGRWVARTAARPALRNVVRLIGAESDMRALYWASDLLVLSSLWEGLPNVALEASASGLPAILSHAANLDAIVAPGETGWEVPTGRQAPLVATLAEALALPRERWRALGDTGRKRVETMFPPERVLAETVATYDGLIAERTPCAA
jgi:glycosyltransferase involved in cell wall biosynthesis